MENHLASLTGEYYMAKIGLFYDTDTGNTRKIAKLIKKEFAEDEIELKAVAKLEVADFDKYSAFILGTPTLGEGELPDNWNELLPQLDGLDLSGKTIALYGLGDQNEYGHEFVNGLGLLYEKFEELGASFIGFWPTEGYEYTVSLGEQDGEFFGLVLDQDNQSDLTPERLATWLAEVKPALLAAASEAEAA
jgi:flavodoxin I